MKSSCGSLIGVVLLLIVLDPVWSISPGMTFFLATLYDNKKLIIYTGFKSTLSPAGAKFVAVI